MSDLELEEQNKAERKTELIAIAADLGPNQLMRFADSIVLLIRPELPNNGHYHALKGIAGGRGTGLVGEATTGHGVRGTSQSSVGVSGAASGSAGVWGAAQNGTGVIGDSQSGSGVIGPHAKPRLRRARRDHQQRGRRRTFVGVGRRLGGRKDGSGCAW
jgi:hypothetical protein